MRKLYGTTFCGNEASEYGKEKGYLDYAAFAKAFESVLCNDIIEKTDNIIGYWEQVSGSCDDIYQYFIVDDNGANCIQDYTNDPLFYNEELNLYVWGIDLTHYGTSWDYVLTDIKLNCGEEAFED